MWQTPPKAQGEDQDPLLLGSEADHAEGTSDPTEAETDWLKASGGCRVLHTCLASFPADPPADSRVMPLQRDPPHQGI